MDAHVKRSECDYLVSRNDGEEGRQVLLQVREGGPPSRGEGDYRAVQNRGWHGREEIHRVPHRPRTGHRRDGRKVDEYSLDGGACEGTDAVLHADEGERLQV